ncbi:MAG: nucleoside deaminase [Planctomycetota bacterium]
MKFVIELSRLNIANQTGGPFAAAIFEINEGVLVSPGLNMVTSTNSSIMHAEIVAIAIAQQLIGNYDLGNDTSKVYELLSSTEPCSMCLGAIPWSGIRRVVCGARGDDAEHIGFDEGQKPLEGILSLEKQGIAVVRDVLRDDAITVLKQYQQSGGQIY